jgi:hypothetical protein
MEHAEDDPWEARVSHQTSDLILSAPPHPWTPTSSSTDHLWLGPTLAGSSAWPLGYPSFTDPFVRTDPASTETILPQQERLRVSWRSHEPSLSPENRTTQPTTATATDCGRSRRQLEGEATRCLERKITKRRKTGPDRFDRYLHGDMPLPPDTTTIDVFKRYPNHITDEDTEELWRLGSSARQISELMPEDTHYNSEGVLVQQHHSLIQKKFKIFKERHEMHRQAMEDRQAQPGGQGLLRLSTSHEASTQESRKTALPSTAGAVAELPDLKFRYYPFDPTNDKAFEARMSIELADLEPVAGQTDHEDHEIHFLDLFLRREFQRHGDLLKYWLIQVQSLELRQASLYNETSRALLRKWHIPRISTAVPATAAEALRLLQHVIDQIYLQHPVTIDLSAKRPIFNFEHRDPRTWRVLGRTLYYLLAITKRLEAGPNAGVPPASRGNSERTPGLLGNNQDGLWSQIMAVSAPEIRPPDGRSPVRGLLSTAFSHEPSSAAYRQSPYVASGEATGAPHLSSPQAPTHFESSSSPTIYGMLSTSPEAIVDHGGIEGPPTPNTRPVPQFTQTSVIPTDCLGPAIPTTTYDLLTEARDSVSFPSGSCSRFSLTGFIALPILILFDLEDGEESDDFMHQVIDWEEWDAVSTARTERADGAN